MDYFYFELKEGKAYVTEEPTSEHSWLWKHDYKNCHSSCIPKEEHKEKWKAHIKKKHFDPKAEDGKLMPHYGTLSLHQTGLYQNADFLILSTQCNRRFSFYLLDGEVPDLINDHLSDDKFVQRYINENAERIFYGRPSEVVSISLFDNTPKYEFVDSTYQYQIYELNDLLDERLLYFAEVSCRCGIRMYYSFWKENIARRFIKDYTKGHFQFCANSFTK